MRRVIIVGGLGNGLSTSARLLGLTIADLGDCIQIGPPPPPTIDLETIAKFVDEAPKPTKEYRKPQEPFYRGLRKYKKP